MTGVPIMVLIIIVIALFTIVFICVKYYINYKFHKKNLELIKSVTSLDRGTGSERSLVLKLLKSGIPSETIFHDLIIKKGNNKFSQVDIVLATTQGIIIIEVKDYSGWIFGNGNQTNWTQVMHFGNNKYRFYNPIKQVKSQILSIKNSFKQFEKIAFFPVIVFCGNSTLREINYVPEGTFIVKPYKLLDAINLIKENHPPAPYKNKREVVNFFKKAVIDGQNKEYVKQHIHNIKNTIGKHRILE
jgi:hypothetical protein